MRASSALALACLTSIAMPDGARRYLVVPAGHVSDSGSHFCRPALSADGRIVAFDATASLDPGDQNGRTDVYVLDRATRQVALVSRNLSGVTGRDASHCPSLSGDGKRVVFESDASDLVDDDQPGTSDVFLVDRQTGRLRRLSLFTGSHPATSTHPAISSDGRVVVFSSRHLDAPATEPTRVYRVSVDTDEVAQDLGHGHSPTVSADGGVIAAVTAPRPGGLRGIRVVSPAGTRTIGHSDRQTAVADVFAPALSADGEWITYLVRTRASGPRDQAVGRAQVYVERVGGGDRRLVSGDENEREGNGHSGLPAIDATGSRVVFESAATNLACSGSDRTACRKDLNLLSDVFLWDRSTFQVTRVNATTPDLPWLEGGMHGAISLDGRTVAFFSRQPVSEADGRDTFDLFVAQR